MALLLLRRRLPTISPRPSRPTPPQAPRRWHSVCSSPAVSPARTRFAPSPTGLVHLGSLRTALYNYLLAKSTGGQFLLRIEDTDSKRTVPGAEKAIYDTLRWAGLHWDEGPEVHGTFGPYRQSERSQLHQHHANLLIEKSHAYRCFCSTERLTALGAARKRLGFPTEYDRTCFNLSREESDARAANNEPFVVRLITPDKYPSYVDEVYGKISGGSNERRHAHGAYEDPVLLKSDGAPTYHLANVVDDHHMEITHVVRATEWMASTPKHVHLYNCFGWEPPKFVHVGLLQDEKKHKLSKRTGDVFVGEYKEKGYLPEALINFVALMGWSHAERSDFMSLQKLVEIFDIKGLTEGNTVVEFGKLTFLQKEHMRALIKEGGPREQEIVAEIEKGVRNLYGDTLETGVPITTAYTRRIIHSDANNITLPPIFASRIPYFFLDPFSPSFTATPEAKKNLTKSLNYLSNYATKHGLEHPRDFISDYLAPLQQLPEWTLERLNVVVKAPEEAEGEEKMGRWKTGMRALRTVLAYAMPGPGMAVTMEMLGRQRTLARLERVMEEEWWEKVRREE